MTKYNSTEETGLLLPNKEEAARELGITLNKGYNGQLTTFEAGKIGGTIGGNKVRQMIKIAEDMLAKTK